MYRIRLSPARVFVEIKYGLLQFARSRQSLFFAFLFPPLIMVLAAFLFSEKSGAGYMEYLVPGIVGVSVMGPALDVTIGAISRNRRTEAYKKLATLPVSRMERGLARAASGIVVAIASSIVSLAFAWLAYGVLPAINIFTIVFIVAGAAMFVGIGTILALLMKNGETANSISLTLTLPLAFISGTMFPVEWLPEWLRYCAMLSPLTYINEGLRVVPGAMTDIPAIAIIGSASVLISLYTGCKRV